MSSTAWELDLNVENLDVARSLTTWLRNLCHATSKYYGEISLKVLLVRMGIVTSGRPSVKSKDK